MIGVANSHKNLARSKLVRVRAKASVRTTLLSNPRFPEKRCGSCWEGPEQTASS
jgi:hypothetical protein